MGRHVVRVDGKQRSDVWRGYFIDDDEGVVHGEEYYNDVCEQRVALV